MSTEVDPLGNVLVYSPRNGGPAVMISVHVDEIGFLVKKIEPNGFIRFEKIGGGDDRILPAQRVWVRGERVACWASSAARSAHLSKGDERNGLFLSGLYRRRGRQRSSGARGRHRDRRPYQLRQRTGHTRGQPGQRLIGKAFDDRLGV